MWLPRKARTLGNELKLEWKSTAHSQMCARKLMCLSFLQIHLNLIANYHFTGSKKKIQSPSPKLHSLPPSTLGVSRSQGLRVRYHFPGCTQPEMQASITRWWGQKSCLPGARDHPSQASSPCRVLSRPVAWVCTKLWPPNSPCPLSSLDFPSIYQSTQHHLFNESRILNTYTHVPHHTHTHTCCKPLTLSHAQFPPCKKW